MQENKIDKVDVEMHLSQFAKSFIEKEWIGRWIHILVEKPEKAFVELVKFERQRNRKTTDYFDKSVAEKVFGNNYQNIQGVYFDGYDEPRNLRLEAAFSEGAGRDALFSIEAGKIAIFFFHEGEVFLCKK